MVNLKLAAVAKETLKITEQGAYRKDFCNIRLPGYTEEKGFTYVEVLDRGKLKSFLKEDVIANKIHITTGAQFYLCNMDSFVAARELEAPLVMNFANAIYPGGGFLNGAVAQEESLCRNSTLYASLSSKAAKKMYEYNRKKENLVDSDYMLLSPNVCVFRDAEGEMMDEPFVVGVITVPAPNKNGRAKNVPQAKLDEVMIDRLRFMLAAAVHYGYQDLVLGAWGCGAFGHDTRKVAEYFFRLFITEGYEYFFRNVAFAIFNDERKIAVFAEVFGEHIESLPSVSHNQIFE